MGSRKAARVRNPGAAVKLSYIVIRLNCRGVGVLMEGIFMKRITHTIQDTTGTKVALLLCQVHVCHLSKKNAVFSFSIVM